MKYLILISVLISLVACTYTERITDGKTAYDRKQYSVAIPMLEKEYEKAKELNDRAEKAYLLGESYRHINETQPAADWYQKAQKNRYGKDTDLKYAQMLLQLQDYDAAKKAFRSAGRYAGDASLYREQMYACDAAQKWLKISSKSLYKVTSLPSNNQANDFSPIIYQKDKIIISSDRASVTEDKAYKWTGKNFFDLYLLDTKSNSIELFEADFNKDYHQGILAFNADKTEVYFTQCGSNKQVEVDYCQILYSQKTAEGWSAPEVVELGDAAQNYIHPVLSEDGNLMIFATTNNEGFGGYDLYYSIRISGQKNEWSKPLNMGSAINSKGNDVFPFLDKDTLYFASNGHAGMGGLDLFRAEKKAKRWQQPQNMKAPINSGGDDFGLVIDHLTDRPDSIVQLGYFSSNRVGGKGNDDIYKFEKQTPPPPDTTILDTPIIVFSIQLEGLVKEKILEQKDNPNSKVMGYQNLMGASIQIHSSDTVFTVGSDIDGTFYTTLKQGLDYDFRVTKKGYFTETATLTTKGIVLNSANPDTTLGIEFVLHKIFTNQEIVLENIYYDLDKAVIRNDAKPTLDSLVRILKKNPTLNIQLASHTDCQGKTSYNQKLSQRRAEAAVLYLIQNDIAADRLTAKGYGESKLAENCKCSDCSPEQHQKNRRTTFLILE